MTSQTALLIVDVQESFRMKKDWSKISAPDIVARVNRLVAHARDQGDAVVWVLHSEPGSSGHFDPASGQVVLQPGLEQEGQDLQITKTSHNAWTTTNLQQQLTARGITHIQIGGIRTEQCVETTARLGSDLGFAVEFVVDATATHPLSLPHGGELSAEAIIERTAAVLSGRFARITTVDEVCAQ